MKLAAVFVFMFTAHAFAAPPTHWVTTWAASPSIQNADPAAMRTRKLEFSDQTVRQIVHVSVGGESLRIKLSNVFGTLPIHVAGAHLAIGASAGNIVAGTDRAITFSDREAVSLPAGAMVLSDPISLKVQAHSDLAVSLYFPDTTMTSTLHYSAQQHSYVVAGNKASAETLTDATTITSWPFLNAIDVGARADTRVVVALGDSITDGAKSEMDANRRWPDVLATRLKNVAVVNAGIGGNRILRDAQERNIAYGVSALARLDRDVFAQDGVTHLIVCEGINDLGYPESTAEEMIAAMKQIAERAHAHGIRVIGGTITPSGRPGAAAIPSEKEKRRQAINDWIRTAKTIDGYVDFDKAIADPQQPSLMNAAYDSGDHLHPNDAGYKAMGEAVDLSLLR